MPGYTLFAESNPQMEHPYEWMGEYAPKGRQRQMKRKKLTHDGRPLSQFYYEDEVQANTIVARVSTMNFLSREAASAARNKVWNFFLNFFSVFLKFSNDNKFNSVFFCNF